MSLKILIAIQHGAEGIALQQELECLGHRVECTGEFREAVKWLRDWQPDLIVTEEGLGRTQPDAGLRLAEFCRATEDQVNGWPGTRTLILIPRADWNRFRQAQQTGAHVILRAANFDAVIRYIQTVVDDLVTDRLLGPALVGIHRFTGNSPCPNCENCQWFGAEIAYGSSKTDVHNLTAVRIVLLNALLFRRRGQHPVDIENACSESPFLRRLLGRHVLRQSAVKMEATRLRRHFDDELHALGAPYTGKHFLPYLSHGAGTYCLSGNRRLVHIPVAVSWRKLSDAS
jgi:hypothetical protein